MRVEVGDEVPSWRMDTVSAERMRTVAAIYRDPTPIHWDRSVNGALGFEGRLLNQTPVNVAYVINMVIAWAGPGSLRRFRGSFPQPVLDGDSATAHGTVVAVTDDDGATVAECEVRLVDPDGVANLIGRVWVTIPDDPG